MATVLSARSDLGAPPPPVVADRLLALHEPSAPARRIPRSRPACAPQRGLQGSAALVFERAAAALTLGRPRPGPQVRRRRSPDLRFQPTSGDGGWSPSGRLAVREWRDPLMSLGRQLVEAMAIAESHSLVESFVRAGPTIVRMVSDLPDAHSAFRTSRSSGGLRRSPRHLGGAIWSSR